MYHYIIVGAGAAGCVLAHRLSADPAVNVLLLEAGRADRDLRIHIPAAFSKLFKTQYDWQYTTDAQPALGGRKLYWPRGRVLGGCSSINAMIYIRGNRQDYDQWAAEGLTGWDYNSLLPYFTRSENNSRQGTHHGSTGPWHINDQRSPNPLSLAFVQAAQQAGYRHNPDFAAGDQTGFGLYQVNQLGGKRHSIAAAFLTPILQRPNLTVLTEAQALRVIVEGKKVTAIEFLHKGRKQKLSAQRSIILAGGAVNTPQLLLLSGIGAADQLRAVKIAQVHDLPGVGQHLADHLVCGVLYPSTQPISLERGKTLGGILEYLFKKTGPLSSNVGEAGGFIQTQGADRPNLQFFFGPNYFLNHGFDNPPGHGYSIGAVLLYPKSSGHIYLRSPNPLHAPGIQPNYLQDPADLDLLVQGMQICRHIGQQAAFAPYRGAELLPGPMAVDAASLAQFVRERVETLYHPVGSCRMGTGANDVVDAQFRVHGLEGLHVADASTMPHIVGGNTQAPTVMIAEKAADEILAQA